MVFGVLLSVFGFLCWYSVHRTLNTEHKNEEKIMRKLLLLIPAFFIATGAMAESPVECGAYKQEITEDIRELGTCWGNKDCGWYDFGYPWQTSPCISHIISTDEEDENKAVLAKIDIYNKQCTALLPDLKKPYDDFNQLVARVECGEKPELICLNGRCVTQTYVLMQGDKEGVDIYGSRKVLDDAGFPPRNDGKQEE